MITQTKTDVEKFVDRVNGLVDEYINDLDLMPTFNDAHKMSKRARIDMLHWIKNILRGLVEKTNREGKDARD